MPYLWVGIILAVIIAGHRRDASIYVVSLVATAALAQCHVAARVAALLGALAVHTTLNLPEDNPDENILADVELGRQSPARQCYTALF